MDDEGQGRQHSAVLDRSEGFGERLLGSLLDRAHEMPPHMIAPLIEQEIAIIGGRDAGVYIASAGVATAPEPDCSAATAAKAGTRRWP